MKSTAKSKTKKGRTDAGQFDIDKQFLLELHEKQNGKCYYSGLPLKLKTNSEWKCSPERLDDNKGYTKDNVVLICLEFNVPYKWTLEKIKLIKALMNKEVDEKKLNELIENAIKKKYTFNGRQPIEKMIMEDGTELIKCNKCDEFKTSGEFYKKISSGCKKCFNQITSKNYESTLRGFIKRRIKSAKYHSQERGKKDYRKDNSNEFNLTFEIIIDKIKEQKGRCYYSGIPLIFERKKIG